jgi:hypothetical protein
MFVGMKLESFYLRPEILSVQLILEVVELCTWTQPISQESESRTFLARFRLENDFLFPMQLLDLGPGEPVSMVVG